MTLRLRPAALALALAMAAASCSTGAGTSTSAGPVTTATSTTATSTSTTTSTTSTTVPDRCPAAACLVYHIRPEAVWSNGSPVTAADFAYTAEARAAAEAGAARGGGHGLIESVEQIDEKTAEVRLSRPFGGWRTLFPIVLPSSLGPAITGIDLRSAPVSGPYVVEDWLSDDRVVLGRNPAYWSDRELISGRALGSVGEVSFVFIEDVRERIEALGRDEVDVIWTRPLPWMTSQLEATDGVEVALAPGPFWDHIDFNHSDPLLSLPWVRRAMTLAIDREAILDATVRGVDPAARGLNNTFFMLGSVNYERHFSSTHDPEAAVDLLEQNGCTRGGDGVFECDGRRMSFTWATTVGDEYRRTQFDLARADLADAGIEIVGEFMTPSELFSTDVFFGGPEAWQIINFSWKAEADPYLANSTYYCEGGAPSGFGSLNVNRYCGERVAELVRATETEMDPATRAEAYNQADAAYLADLPLIPLYQKPEMMAWDAGLVGPKINISRSTNLWNLAAWLGKESVVVALELEPVGLDPLAPGPEEAVLASILYHGAFGIDPAHEFHPVLVDEVEVIVEDG